MLAGYPPFFDDNPFGIYEKILAGKIEWPRHLDPVAKDLIKKLLVQDRTKRLGNMKVCFLQGQTSVLQNVYHTLYSSM
jgi:protein kinase X